MHRSFRLLLTLASVACQSEEWATRQAALQRRWEDPFVAGRVCDSLPSTCQAGDHAVICELCIGLKMRTFPSMLEVIEAYEKRHGLDTAGATPPQWLTRTRQLALDSLWADLSWWNSVMGDVCGGEPPRFRLPPRSAGAAPKVVSAWRWIPSEVRADSLGEAQWVVCAEERTREVVDYCAGYRAYEGFKPADDRRGTTVYPAYSIGRTSFSENSARRPWWPRPS